MAGMTARYLVQDFPPGFWVLQQDIDHSGFSVLIAFRGAEIPRIFRLIVVLYHWMPASSHCFRISALRRSSSSGVRSIGSGFASGSGCGGGVDRNAPANMALTRFTESSDGFSRLAGVTLA